MNHLVQLLTVTLPIMVAVATAWISGRRKLEEINFRMSIALAKIENLEAELQELKRKNILR